MADCVRAESSVIQGRREKKWARWAERETEASERTAAVRPSVTRTMQILPRHRGHPEIGTAKDGHEFCPIVFPSSPPCSPSRPLEALREVGQGR